MTKLNSNFADWFSNLSSFLDGNKRHSIARYGDSRNRCRKVNYASYDLVACKNMAEYLFFEYVRQVQLSFGLLYKLIVASAVISLSAFVFQVFELTGDMTPRMLQGSIPFLIILAFHLIREINSRLNYLLFFGHEEKEDF